MTERGKEEKKKETISFPRGFAFLLVFVYNILIIR